MSRDIKGERRVGEEGRVGERGFTLMELLAVIGILIALVGVIFPVIFGVIDKAKIARVSVDMLEFTNGAAKHFDDVGQFPITSGVGTSGCDQIEFSSFVTAVGLSNWKGPYIDKESANAPYGVPYFLCPVSDGSGSILIGGDCDDSALYGITTYAFAITFDLSNLSSAARARISKALDKAIDGKEGASTGKVRYQSGGNSICVGFVGPLD